MMRIGHGYDVHRLVTGRKLILGGVDIPHETGLLGHSDADVLTHAVMDAIVALSRKSRCHAGLFRMCMGRILGRCQVPALTFGALSTFL